METEYSITFVQTRYTNMKKYISLYCLLLGAVLFSACKMESTPEQYFDRAALNSNLLTGFGAQDFRFMRPPVKATDLMVVEDNKTRKAVSYEEYIQKYKVYSLNQEIEKIKALKPTDETKPMLDASLELFGLVKQKYETDYVKIARLQDAGTPAPEVDKAIADMEAAAGPTFEALYKKLMDIALPYAQKHGIKVTQNKF